MSLKFSLIIPLAPERSAEILGSIKELDYPKNEFETIVISGRNPSDNRNKGIEKSLGDIIVFLDDDGVIEKDYLKKIEDFFNRNPNVDVVGGPQLTPKDEKGFAKISGYALSSLFGAWKLANRYSAKKEILDVNETAVTSANLICKKPVLEKVRFDVNLFPGEDPKFISDAKKQGFKIAYSPNILIYHRRRPSFKLLIKQMFNYGKVRPAKESFFQTIKMPFFLIPSAFLIYLFLLIASIIANPSITGNVVNAFEGKISYFNFVNLGFLWFLPILAYIFLSILFAVYDSVKNKDYKAFFVLPFIYPVIHLSYGAGMLYGYWKKI